MDKKMRELLKLEAYHIIDSCDFDFIDKIFSDLYIKWCFTTPDGRYNVIHRGPSKDEIISQCKKVLLALVDCPFNPLSTAEYQQIKASWQLKYTGCYQLKLSIEVYSYTSKDYYNETDMYTNAGNLQGSEGKPYVNAPKVRAPKKAAPLKVPKSAKTKGKKK